MIELPPAFTFKGNKPLSASYKGDAVQWSRLHNKNGNAAGINQVIKTKIFPDGTVYKMYSYILPGGKYRSTTITINTLPKSPEELSAGFTINNPIGYGEVHYLLKTSKYGFEKIEKDTKKIAADLKNTNGQWLGKIDCVTWNSSNVFINGDSFKVCNISNSAVQCAFIKDGYVIVVCSGVYGTGFKIRVFSKSKLISANDFPYNTLNPPMVEFLDCFNGFTDDALYKDITVNRIANKIVLIGNDNDTTGTKGSVRVYNIGKINTNNIDWLVEDVGKRFENEDSEFRHFCYWDDLNNEQFAYSTYFPVVGESNPKTTYYRGFTFNSYQELAIGVNRYIDDITLLDGSTDSIIWSGSVYDPNPFYPGKPYKHTFLINRTYSQRSKRNIFNIVPEGIIVQPEYFWWSAPDEIPYPHAIPGGLGGGDPINNSNYFMICYSDIFNNMVYTYKIPESYHEVGQWPITSGCKALQSNFVSVSESKQISISALVQSPSNLIGVI